MLMAKTPVPPVTSDDLVVRTFTAKDGLVLPYRLYVPRDYLQSRTYPLLIVLHGSGERGSDNEQQLANGVLAWCDPRLQKRHPTFVIYPQCPTGARWVESSWSEGRYQLDQVPLSRPLDATIQLAVSLEQEFTLDRQRYLVNGISMGGYGTWDAITRFPDMFAGAMPICGGGDPTRAAALAAIPIWAFHGSADDVVPVTGSRAMVEAVRKAGGRIKYSELKGVGHHVWEKVYSQRPPLEWLVTQKRRGGAVKVQDRSVDRSSPVKGETP